MFSVIVYPWEKKLDELLGLGLMIAPVLGSLTPPAPGVDAPPSNKPD
jgi:hypothetical protein